MDDDLLPAGALAMIGEITAGPATATMHGPLQGAWFTQFLTDWAGAPRPVGELLLAEPRIGSARAVLPLPSAS